MSAVQDSVRVSGVQISRCVYVYMSLYLCLGVYECVCVCVYITYITKSCISVCVSVCVWERVCVCVGGTYMHVCTVKVENRIAHLTPPSLCD